jgi:hypothetical protein
MVRKKIALLIFSHLIAHGILLLPLPVVLMCYFDAPGAGFTEMKVYSLSILLLTWRRGD